MSGQLATPEMESTASELPRTSKTMKNGLLSTDNGPMLCQTSDLLIMENLRKTQNVIIEIGESTINL